MNERDPQRLECVLVAVPDTATISAYPADPNGQPDRSAVPTDVFDTAHEPYPEHAAHVAARYLLGLIDKANKGGRGVTYSEDDPSVRAVTVSRGQVGIVNPFLTVVSMSMRGVYPGQFEFNLNRSPTSVVTSGTLRLGRVALRVEEPTPDQLNLFDQRHVARDMRRRREVVGSDRLFLANRDHMTFTIGDSERTFVLPLGSPSSFVAARTIEVLRREAERLPRRDPRDILLNTQAVAWQVLHDLSPDELALLPQPTGDKWLVPDNNPILDLVGRFLRDVAASRIVTSGDRGANYRMIDMPTNVRISSQPYESVPELTSGEAAVTIINAPETRQERQVIVTEDDRRLAEAVASSYQGDVLADQEKLVRYLDLIVSPAGKVALYEQAAATGADPGDLILGVRDWVKRSIRNARLYEQLLLNRTIAGYTPTGGEALQVAHVSGEMPLRTNVTVLWGTMTSRRWAFTQVPRRMR